MGPRALELALAEALPGLRPATTLARVQETWPSAVGQMVSEEAQPVSELAGTVTVRCRSSVWAQELQLLSCDLLAGLNAALEEGGGEASVAGLRFVVEGPESPV